MDGFGEPVGGKFVAHAFFLGAPVEHRTGGGELIAEAEVVEEAGHLAIAFASLRGAGNQVRQGREGIEIERTGRTPGLALVLLIIGGPGGDDDDGFGVMGMDGDPVGGPDGFHVDFGYLDRSQVHALLDPVDEKDRIDGIGAAHGDVGAAHGVLGVTDRGDRHLQRFAPAPGKRLAVYLIG